MGHLCGATTLQKLRLLEEKSCLFVVRKRSVEQPGVDGVNEDYRARPDAGVRRCENPALDVTHERFRPSDEPIASLRNSQDESSRSRIVSEGVAQLGDAAVQDRFLNIGLSPNLCVKNVAKDKRVSVANEVHQNLKRLGKEVNGVRSSTELAVRDVENAGGCPLGT
jgi:hypothetical protein